MTINETPAEPAVAPGPEASVAAKIAWLETWSTRLDARGIVVLNAIFRPFMDEHYNPVRRYLRNAGVPETDDAVSEVFAAFFYRVKDNGGHIGLRKMLAQNTRWRILHHVRDTSDVPEMTEVPSSGSAPPASVIDIEKALDDHEKARRFLLELTPEQRAVVEKGILEELTDTEIAAALGIPEGTVKSRLRAALRVLRELGAALPASQQGAA